MAGAGTGLGVGVKRTQLGDAGCFGLPEAFRPEPDRLWMVCVLPPRPRELLLFTPDAYDRLVSSITAFDEGSQERRLLETMFFDRSAQIETTHEGVTCLPAPMLTTVGLYSPAEIVLRPHRDTLQVWPVSVWENYVKARRGDQAPNT